MADVIRKFGVQFVLENTKSVLNDADKFIAQMEKKTEKIDLTSEIKTEFEKLSDYLKNNFKNGLNLSSQFSNIINSKDIDEAIGKIEDLSDSLKLVNTILNYDGGTDESFKKMLSELNSQQLTDIFQVARNQKPRATHKTKQSNLLKVISDTYALNLKDKGSLSQTTEISKELEGVLKNIGEDIKSIRQSVNSFEQKGIKSTLAGITAEMTQQGEAGQALNDVFVGLVNALGEYQKQGRKGLNIPENKSGETDVPKTPKEIKEDDPVTKELKKYGELDKTLATFTNENTFFNNFKSQAKDIASAIDKLKSMKISLEDIQKVYPRLVQGYRMWVAVQNQDSKNKISGLYEQKLEQEKLFYRSSREVHEGLVKSTDVKQSQEEYQAKSASFDNQINEELNNAIKEGILTQQEVNEIKAEYGRKLKEATDAIDREVKEIAINSRLSDEEKEKRRKQEEERKKLAAEAKIEAEKERLREEKRRQEKSTKKQEVPVEKTENDLKLNRLKEMVSKENELFNKKDLKSYQEYMNSIREESLQLQKELSELNILPNDRQTNTFLRSQGNREAIVIDNALKAKQKEIEKVKNNPEEFKKQYQEAAEFILEAQKRLEELEANGSKIAKNKIKENELFLNKENYFKKMIPNPNQEEIDYSIKELKRLEEELRTPIKGEFDPDKRTDYEQAYKDRIDLIKEYREQLKQLGATEEEMSILKGNALDKDYWIDILRQKREARRKEREGQAREDELDTFEASNDLARNLSGQDYNASRAVEDESIKGQSKYGDEINELSEEAEKIEQLTNTIKEYRSQMDETADIAQKIQIYNELQSKIEEIKTEYQELYTIMQENDEDMTQTLSWDDIESNYIPKKQEIESLKQQLETPENPFVLELDTSSIDAQTEAIDKNIEVKEKAGEVSNNTDNTTENSQEQETTNILNQQTEALDKNTEASERNQQAKKKGNIIITTGDSQSQPNSFTTPNVTNNSPIVESAETIRENIIKAVKKTNAKYEIDATDIVLIKTDGLEGLAKDIATKFNTALVKYNKLTGLVPVNEEAIVEAEEYKATKKQIEDYQNTIFKDMKFVDIFATNKNGKKIKNRKISFDDLSQMPKAQQQMIFEDKIISLYNEASSLSERINSGKGGKAQIEKAKEKLSILKEQMIALLSEFTEIGSMFSHYDTEGDTKIPVYVNPLEHLNQSFSERTRQAHVDITDEDILSTIGDFTQWLKPFIEEKDAMWSIGQNLKEQGKKIVDSHGRPIKVFDANASSNYNLSRNIGQAIQANFDKSSMFSKNGNLQLTSEELQQISDLFPKSPIDNRYLKESINPQEVFIKIQQIIANAIQRNIDTLSTQLENGADVELPLKASRTALAQLYKSMGIPVENPKSTIVPVTQPISTSQQPSSTLTVQQPTDNVGQIASETSKRLIEEGENAKVVGISFQDAALAKQAFTEANKEAKVSAEETAVAIAEETSEAEQVATEFDLVAEKTREAVAKITSENQKSLTPEEVLNNPASLVEQIEKITQGELVSAQTEAQNYYTMLHNIFDTPIENINFDEVTGLPNSLEVQTDSLLKLLSQVGVVGSEGFNQLITSMKQVEQTIASTDNEVNNLYRTFNNTKIKGISKLSETQLMGKADNSLLEMERLYNENKEETNEFLLEQLKIKQILDEMIKRSGGRSELGVTNDFDAYEVILDKWVKNGSLVSDEKATGIFSSRFWNISDETGKSYGTKKAIEEWVRPFDYQNLVSMGQQFGIILDYITQNQEALKLVHDQLQANLPIIETTADEMKEIAENAEQAAEVVDKVVDKTETPVQEEAKPFSVVTTDNSQKTNNKFVQLSDKEILDKYKKNQEYEDALKYFYTEEEILSGRASSHKADYIKLREENAELEQIIQERGLLNDELREEVVETGEIITISEEGISIEKEKPKNLIEEKWEKIKKRFGIETPDYSKLTDKEILAEYGKMSGKMIAQRRLIKERNKGIDVSQMTDEQLLSDSIEIFGKEVFIGFRRNTEELKRLIEERKIVIGEQKQVVEETKEQLKKDEETSSSTPSSIHTTPIVHPVDVMPTFDIEDFSKKTDDEIKALSRKKKNELADVIHLNLAQRIDLSSMTDEEILADSNIKNKNAYFRLREENKELDKIIEERKLLDDEKKKIDAEINQPPKKEESQKVQEKPIVQQEEPVIQEETPAIEQHTEALDKASESANNLEQNLNDVAESLGEIEKKEEQLGQAVTEAEVSAQPLKPEQTITTTSELEETKNKVVELEQQIKNLQNQAQKFDFGDKAIETLKEFEKILKSISQSLIDIDAKWKGIYANNASNFKKAVAEEGQKLDTKSNNPTKTTNDIIKDQFKSDLIALTNKNSKTGIYGRDSLRMKNQSNKLFDPKDIDNLEKADALFDKIAKRIQNLKKSKSLNTILDDPEIKALLEERKNQIDYVRRSKLKKNQNDKLLKQQQEKLQGQIDADVIVKAYDTMTAKARDYYELRDKQDNGENLTNKEKDRLEQLEQEYQEATDIIIAFGRNKSEVWENESVINAEQRFLDKNALVNEELDIKHQELDAKRQEEDIQAIINAYNLLTDKMRQYYSLKEKQNNRNISDSERDKLEQLEKQYQSALTVLIEFARNREELWQDNRIVEAEQGFLKKEKQVKGEQDEKRLENALKPNRQESLENKAKEIQDSKDAQELINIYNQLYNTYFKYQQLKEKQSNVNTPLSSAELKQVQDLEIELDKLNAKLLEMANNKSDLWNRMDVVDAESIFKNRMLNIDSIGDGDKVKNIIAAYDKKFSAEDKIRSLTVQQASSYNANRAKQIADLQTKVKEYTQTINENTQALKDNNDAVALNIVNNAEQRYTQKTKNSVNALNEGVNTDRINKAKTTVASLEELHGEYSSGDYINQQELLEEIETKITNINELIKDLNAHPLDITNEDDLDKLTQIDKELSNYKKDIADIKKDSKDYQTANGSKTARSIAEFISKNSGISQEAKDTLQQYINLIEKGVNVSQLKAIGAGFEDIKRQEIEAGRTGMTFFDMLGQRVKGLAATLMTYVSFWRIFSEFKQGLQIIRQFDDALAEMQKVSNESLNTLKEFQTTTFDLADSIGSDALALQQSVAEFMRLGQSLEEATDSAKSANILLNVSEFTSASEASEALIAMSQAYEDLSNIEIIDVINKLGNDFPISTQGLATALQDGAASLTTAGNSFYEAAALVTAGNRITQDPSKVGKAMRTIALRLTGTEASKTELEEDGEEVEGMITNVSKLRDVIMQATKVGKNNFKGFDILKDNGAYKSTYEILLGIADIYQDIVENDEKYGTKGANLLLETIAGKNRASIAASILQSPDMLRKAYAEALDAEGSAEIENAKFIDSISGHLEKLKNAWQEVWANTLNRDIINFFLDLGTAILKVVSNIGLLPSLGIFGGLVATLFEFANGTGLIVKGLEALNAVLTVNTVLTGANTEAVEAETAANLSNAASQGAKEASKTSTIIKNLTNNFGLLGNTISKIFTAIGGIKGLLGGGVIIGSIITAIKAYDALNLSAKETAKEAKEISSAFEESMKNIQEHKDTINDLSDTYQKLSSGVNTFTNANLTLSNDEYEQYLNTCNKIADLYPQLVTGYDLQGNAIVNLTGNVNALRDALIEEQKVAANTFLEGGEKQGFFDKLFGFFGLGNKKSIKDNFDKNYEDYKDTEVLKDYFLGREITLEDYKAFEADWTEKAFNGDNSARSVLSTLGEISGGIIDSDEKLQSFLNHLRELNMSSDMQQSMKQAQQTLLSELTKNDGYWDLIYSDNEKIKSFAPDLFTNMVNGLSPEQFSELFSKKDGVKQYADSLIKGISSALSGANSNTLMDVIADMNNFISGEGTLAKANMGDFTKIADSYKQAFIEAFADSEIDGAEVFSAMFNDNGVSELKDRFNQILNTTSFTKGDEANKQQALDYFNSLGKEEAEMYAESFKDATSFEDVDRKFGSFQRSLAAKTHEAIINIENETAAINTLKSAISSSNGDTGLSSEEITNLETLFKDLMDEDGNPLYSAPELFENTANGIRLNQKQLKKLNNEYKRERIEEATDKLDYYQKALIETQNEIDKLRGVQGKEADLSAEERNRDNILQNIDALQREITQYEGLTSAYNEYVNALSTTNGNAGYDTIQSGYDTVKDLIDRGWGGADEVRQYVQMFTAEDVSTWSVEQLIERFNELDDAINSAGYSYKDFFTVDEDGKTTSDGVFNFLDALKQEAKDKAKDYNFSDAMIDQLVSVEKRYSDATHQMEDFYSFDFDAIGGDQAVADLMNMDISTLHKWLEAAEAAGFDVVWTDYAHKVAKATDNIKKAKEALEEFKEVNAEEYKLNTSADTIEDVNAELEKAQELITKVQSNKDLSPEASTASLDYIQVQLDKLIQTKLILEQPLLFDTNLADVEGDYQDLFLALQNYGMELQTVQAYSKAGLPIDTSQADKKLQSLLKAFGKLDEETRKEFGIDFDLEDEDALEKLKEKLANEEITIPINQVMGNSFDYSKLPQGKDTIVKVRTVFDDNGAIQGLQLVDSLGNVIDGSYYTANVNAVDNASSVANTAQEHLEDISGTYTSELKVDVNDKEANNANKTKTDFQKGASSYWNVNSNIQSFYKSFINIRNDFVKPRTTTWTIKQVSKASGTAVRPATGSGGGGFVAPQLYRGTAHALGTAYARGTSGNWGVPEDQDALTGELGEELVVRDGHFFTVGSESAEMVHLQKGDIVFNADQTKQIFEKGRILNGSRRGRAHADGTAYSAGSGGRRRVNAVVASSKTTNNSSNNNNNKSSSNKSSNTKEGEKMDWIAIAIERIEQQIDELNDAVDSVYRSWSDRNQALADEIKAVSDEIAIQEAGYKRYLKEAESIGLSAAYAKKVREGTIDIEKITDENLKKKIDEYQQWCVLRPLIW